MRITDRTMQNLFLSNLNVTQNSLSKIQQQIITKSKVNSPSDDPLAAARIISLRSQISNNSTYSDNIDNAASIVNGSTSSMQSMQDEIQKILTQLTDANNATVSDSLSTFADQVDLGLKSLLDLANSEYNGQYLFGGTDNSQKPYGYDSTGTRIVAQTDTSGVKKVKISSGIDQKINTSGEELFSPVLQQNGNLGSAAAGAQTATTLVYDSSGNKYNFSASYTKTASNTYSVSYAITDSAGAAVYPSGASVPDTIQFDSSGNLSSINGSSPKTKEFSIPGKNIDFKFDMSGMKETSSSSSLGYNLTQKTNIFDTLLSIKNELSAGQRPSDDQYKIVQDFNSHLLNKLSDAGNVSNRLTDTSDMLSTQALDLTQLLSNSNDTDMAEAVINLQTEQNTLDLTYKTSAMILPKSLLDYL